MICLIVKKSGGVWIARYSDGAYTLLQQLTARHIAAPSTFRDLVGDPAVADVWERAIAEHVLPTMAVTVSEDSAEITARSEHGEVIDIDATTVAMVLKPAIGDSIPVLVEEYGGGDGQFAASSHGGRL